MADQTFGIRDLQGDGAKVVQNLQRRRVETGALPNATTKNVAHGITGLNLANIVRIWGTATDGSTVCIPLPYPDSAAFNAQLEVTINATQVVLIASGNLSGFTSSTVYIEYIP